MYHGVDNTGDTRYNLRHIARANLKRQLRYLRKEYTLVSLSDLYETPNPGVRRMAITFDDGLENNFTHAAPVLRSLQIPATFFVTSSPQHGHRSLWPDAVNVLTAHGPHRIQAVNQEWHRTPWNRFINAQGQHLTDVLQTRSWEEIHATVEDLQQGVGKRPEELAPLHTKLMQPQHLRTLDRHPLFEIGAHGHSHLPLGLLTAESQLNELRTCKDELEQILQKTVRSVAYPLGSYQRQTLDVAESLGFNRQLAVNYQFKEDHFDPRLMARFGTVEDRSWVEQLHQINTRFYAEPRQLAANTHPLG